MAKNKFPAFTKTIGCPACTGTGQEACKTCAGTGWMQESTSIVPHVIVCPNCHGSKHAVCHMCHGEKIMPLQADDGRWTKWQPGDIRHPVNQALDRLQVLRKESVRGI